MGARRVVVGQAVVTTAHYVEGAEVATRELHRAEEVVPDVRAEEVVLALGHLGAHAHQQLVYCAVGQDLL